MTENRKAIEQTLIANNIIKQIREKIQKARTEGKPEDFYVDETDLEGFTLMLEIRRDKGMMSPELEEIAILSGFLE